MIEHVVQSIRKAKKHKSKVGKFLIDIKGYSSPKIRHLLNNVLEIPEAVYLEIGVFTGSTFIPAVYHNKLKKAYCVDNWSQYVPKNPKRIFLQNIKEFNINKFLLIEEDCFQLNLSQIKEKVNVYLYDGPHDEVSQYKALEYYLPVLEDEFVFMVDDYDYIHIQEGTQKAIRNLGLEIKYENHLHSKGIYKDSWWRGFYIAILKKK